MKKQFTLTFFLVITFSLLNFANPIDLKKDFIPGDPGIKSINSMAFGPQGILFIGDSKAAQIVALDMSDFEAGVAEEVGMKNIDGQIAELLGSPVDQIQITDMVVNPVNQNIYLAVHHSSGIPVLLSIDGTDLQKISLAKISHSKSSILDPVAENAEDGRGRPLRKWAISDIHYHNGKVMLSGLSNKKFASTFRSVEFPFNDKQDYSSIEIYHAAHGKYETHAPIKAFSTVQLNNESHVIASYTCTPLVVFPMSSLKSGEHSKGRTIAELGNWNTPLDIIEMEKEGNRYILMANSNRALMKIKVKDIEKFGDSLTTPVTERSGTAGVEFINLPFVNVQHLAKLNEKHFVMIQREANGDLVLKTGNDRWL